MAVVNLTEGAITSMYSDNFTSEQLPVLQVIDLKLVQIQQNRSLRRFRVVLSDGVLYQQGMLAPHKNDLVDSGKLQIGSIVKLTQFFCNHVADRMIIIIIDLDILMDKYDLIGVPRPAPRKAANAEKVNFASEPRVLLELTDKLRSLKVEGGTPNSVTNNNAGLLSVETGQAMAPVYTPPIRSNTPASRDYGMPGNQYNCSFASPGATSGSYMSCNYCGGSGRVSAGSGVASGECFKCHQTGHWASDCPSLSAAPPAYGSGNEMQGRYGVAQNQQFGGY